MRLVFLVAIAGALAGLLALEERDRRNERRLAEVAGALAGRPVSVRCQGPLRELVDVSPESGTVGFDAEGRPADATDLERPVCEALRRFPETIDTDLFACLDRGETCPDAAFDAVQAVHTLAHEAWHLAGIRSEATAECFALQTTRWTAARLGAPPARAEALAAYAVLHLYPALPARYRSPECRDGGALDLLPHRLRWP